MKTIYKYTLGPECSFDIPLNAELLSVHEQNGEICLWALVDPANKKEIRDFRLYGTGHNVDKLNLKFVGTALLHDGALVFHVFEKL